MSDYNESEKNMLIESMAKLIEHIHDSKVHQAEIFNSLTNNDLLKILSNVEDKNLKLRKTSCRFLCELLYENTKVQDLFCDLTGVLPIDGKVCINKIPESFNQHMKFMPEILELIKNCPIPENQNVYINSELLKIQHQMFYKYINNSCQVYKSKKNTYLLVHSRFIKIYKHIFIIYNVYEHMRFNLFLCTGKVPLCWYFSSDIDNNQPFKVQFFFPQGQDNFDSSEFIDPQETLFGFMINSQYKSKRYEKGLTTLQDIQKYQIEKDSYKSQRNNQTSMNSSRVSPIKKREVAAPSNNSGSFIKKIQFNSSSSRQDRSFSGKFSQKLQNQKLKIKNEDKKESQKLVKSNLGNSQIQDNMEQSYLQNYQNQLSKNGQTSQEYSKEVTVKDSQLHNKVLGDNSMNDSLEIADMANIYSPYSPRLELELRQKHNSNSNKYSLLERRKTAEGINEKSLKFKNATNTSIVKQKNKLKTQQKPSQNKSKYLLQQQEQKKRESSNSVNKNPQNSQSMVHGVQIKKFQLQSDTNQNQNGGSQNSSFDNLKFELKYDSQKQGYSLKDKRYSQQEQNQKQSINEKRNVGNTSTQGVSSKNNAYSILSKSTIEHPMNENNLALYPNQTPKFTNLDHKNYLSSKNSNGFSIQSNGYGNIQNTPQNNSSNTPQQQPTSSTPTNYQNGIQKKLASLHNKSLVSKSLSINYK